MKQIIPIILLLGLSMISMSQSTTGPSTSIQTDYLKKSKHQATAGIILLSGGGVLFVTGLAVYPMNYDIFFETTPEKESQANTAGALMLTGMVSMVASIPFLVMSTVNKRKAQNVTSLGFKMETAPVIQQRSLVRSSFPSLALKIPL